MLRLGANRYLSYQVEEGVARGSHTCKILRAGCGQEDEAAMNKSPVIEARSKVLMLRLVIYGLASEPLLDLELMMPHPSYSSVLVPPMRQCDKRARRL